MNFYRYLPGIVLVLLLTVVAMVFRGMILTESEEGGTGAVERGRVSRDLGTDGAKSSRRERPALSPAAGLRKLRSLLGEGAEEAPQFRELEAMARRVKSADLWQLVESSQQDTAWTLGGWVRAAALAELSRREPNETLGEVLRAGWSEDAATLHAALFAVFRGWSEIDPAAAIEALSRTSVLLAGPNYETGIFRSEGRDLTARGGEEWKEQAYREVFAQWARRNPDTEALPLPPGGLPDYRTAAWEGLLRGLRDPVRIRKLLAVRLEEMSAAAPSLASSDLPDGVVLLVPPSADPVVVAGLLSLARGGMQESLAWLKEHPLTSLTASSEFLRQYGAAHPERALDLLEDPAMDATALATGIVSRDPARAVEVIEGSGDSLETGKVLLAALSAGGLGEAGNRYPGSGGLSRPLDIKQRADFLKGAIDDSSLDEAVKAILHLEIEVRRIEYETASEVGHIKGAIRFPNVDENR